MRAMEPLSRWMRAALRRVRPHAVLRDMQEEMRVHIDMEAESLMRDGMPTDEARRRALAGFGGVTQYVEESRDAWPLYRLVNVIADVRFAVRSLRRAPSFALTAILALAL